MVFGIVFGCAAKRAASDFSNVLLPAFQWSPSQPVSDTKNKQEYEAYDAKDGYEHEDDPLHTTTAYRGLYALSVSDSSNLRIGHD